MSTTIHQHQEKSTSELNHKFSISWEIKDLCCLKEKTIKTPPFSPIPDSDATFYFEFSYMVVHNSERLATCKLVLFWNSCLVNVPKSMKMNLTVTFESKNAAVLKKYEKNGVSFDEKNSFIILNTVDSFNDGVYDYDINGYRYRGKDREDISVYSVIQMKCNFIFYEHLNSPTDYFRDKKIFEHRKYFVEDFACMYNSSQLSDIKFKIGDELLPAHKSILAAHSPVFLKMLSSDFQESKTNIISIVDSTPEIFNIFLKFLYCGEIEDESWLVVKELCVLADKYDVRSLKRNCGDLLASFLSIDKVCEILKLAYTIQDDDLKLAAKSFVVKYFDEITSKEDWKELAQSSPNIAYEVVMSFISKPI